MTNLSPPPFSVSELTGYASAEVAAKNNQREAIVIFLQKIGKDICENKPLAALWTADDALAAFPDEPVLYLRRADLLVQRGNHYRVDPGLSIFAESTRMLDKLEALQGTASAFTINNSPGSREKRSFLYVYNRYGVYSWLGLQERIAKVANFYFPYVDEFKQSASGPVRMDAGSRSATLIRRGL